MAKFSGSPVPPSKGTEPGERLAYERWKEALTDAGPSSYSGTDVEVAVLMVNTETNDYQTVSLESIQTISISTMRGMGAVRRLGDPAPETYVGGARTVAGTMVLTVLDYDPLFKIFNQVSEKEYSSPFFVDLVPEFSLILTAHNELGQAANMAIHGVRLANTGTVYSVDDMMTEMQVTYVATRIEPFLNREAWLGGLRERYENKHIIDRMSTKIITEELQAKPVEKIRLANGSDFYSLPLD